MRLPFTSAAGSVTGATSRSRGQSLTEFALFLPVLLLLVLVALDFGRIYLGWINLQQMARVAANYAADNSSAWNPLTIDNAKQARYEELIENDARKSVGCVPQDPLPDPVFGGMGLGAQVTVTINCEFTLLTPGIQALLGPSINATGSATFPVKEGVVAAVPGGGAPVGIAPVAQFDVSPRTGWSALEVTFTDTSLNGATSWSWDFSVSPTTTGTGAGSVSDGVSSAEGPHTITYTCTGVPGDTCTWGVSLSVSNPTGTSSQQLDNWITVTVPPDTGPIAEFTGTPRSGIQPLTVDFEFVDLRAGVVTYTSWDWDFGDGTTGSGETVSHTYNDEGSYDVTLTVSDGTTDSTLQKLDYIVVGRRVCIVPDFGNRRAGQAQRRWEDAGFTTTVTLLPGPNNYAIQYQSIVGGTVDPQPDGCDSAITVGPTQP